MTNLLYFILTFMLVPGPGHDVLDSAVVRAGRAGTSTPVAHSEINATVLRKAAATNSLPKMLSLQPSVVYADEGGTGLGYSSMRVRGVTGNQTAVSFNGITLNDAETQEVFWVNIPAIGKYLGSVQLQRGLGTSASGPGAFGACIDMNASVQYAQRADAEIAAGSFGTFSSFAHFSTGLTSYGLFADAAASWQRTDGYVRNGFARVGSFYATAGWRSRYDLIRLVLLHGKQKSGITWEGVPLAIYDEGNFTYNPAGRYIDDNGDVRYYDNQTDNFRQTHVQLEYSHEFTSSLVWRTTLDCTDGFGFYEQYRTDFLPSGDAVTRDYEDNTLWVARSELTHFNHKVKSSAGIYLSTFGAVHSGETIKPSVCSLYSNDARKSELDAWMRFEWTPLALGNFYADMQFRSLRYLMSGPDEYGQILDYDSKWDFFNPRIGASFTVSDALSVYSSVASGHREPRRPDIQESYEVKPEKMVDLEIGGKIVTDIWKASANVYFMEYFDMLVETGRLDYGGYSIKENTPRAWRRGIELTSDINLGSTRIEGNISLSTNKIKKTGKDILLSPPVVGMLSWTNKLWKGAELNLTGKFVGPQYWDNTSDPSRRVPAYFVQSAKLRQEFEWHGTWALSINIDNLFNKHYYAYAWVSRYVQDGKTLQTEGLFPQAPLNAQFKLEYHFPGSAL